MAFCFSWPTFDFPVIERARHELETALNRGSKPSNICDVIRVKELRMGSKPPELEILEIGELSEERFRGIFKIVYNGDAQVMLQTKVQANPLNFGENTSTLVGPSMMSANAPLIVPLELQISEFKIRGIFVLIVSLQRGVTVSFKNDPLESVQVNSTFDNVPSIRNHLQKEIEQRLADLFREELPLTIHQVSMEAIKKLADRIPPPFRTSLPTGQFRNRRSSEPPSRDVSSTPSRTNSPPNSNSTVFDEIYYFRRNSVIHRTASKYSICDPLVNPVITDIRRRGSTLMEDFSGVVEKIPLIGEDAKELLERFSAQVPKKQNVLEGLKDPVLFQSSKFGSQTFVINSGSLQLSLSKDMLEGLSGESEKILRRPSVYKALRSNTDNFHDDSLQMNDRQLDPDEFRSVDSLTLARPRIKLDSDNIKVSRAPILGTAALQRAVQRSSLPGRLQILRVLHENPTPFDTLADRNVVHRSSPQFQY